MAKRKESGRKWSQGAFCVDTVEIVDKKEGICRKVKNPLINVGKTGGRKKRQKITYPHIFRRAVGQKNCGYVEKLYAK